MGNMYEKLFSPYQIGQLKIKNRIAMAPMGGTNIDEAEYFIERARGGAGLLVSGITLVQNTYDLTGFPVEFDNPLHFLERHGPMMEKIHAYGAKMFRQLTAGTGRCTPALALSPDSASASELPNVWDNSKHTQALSVEAIQHYVKSFARAAMICKMAGYDGVEIHAVHEGYLLDQFAISFFNKRTDQYGGCLENRARFAVEILQAIKHTCGADFPVSLRYSVKSCIKDFNDGAVPGEKYKEVGRDLEEGIALAKYLESAGYDMLNCDNGTYDSWYWPHPPVYMPEGLNIADIYEVKKAVSIPVLAAGRLEDPDLAESVLQQGKADAITIGRQLLADPYYPQKVKQGTLDEIKPCIACHIGCLGRVFQGKVKSCTVNPACGNEHYFRLRPAEVSKHIVIVGGGIAGMEAALISAQRGHRVSLYEQGDQLGGVFIAAAAFDFKKQDKKLIQWYIRQLKKHDIAIHLQTRVDRSLIAEIKPDAVLVATGSTVKELTLDGSERAVAAVDFLLGDQQTGHNVVIIGGGLTGCEIAYNLARQEKNVSIIEILPDVLPDKTLCAANRSCLLDMMKFHHVNEYVSTTVKKITPDSVVIQRGDIEEVLAADTVIYAIGYERNQALYDELYSGQQEVFLLGDAINVSNLLNAIWTANEVARNI